MIALSKKEEFDEKCEEMLSYYDDDCFLRRGGKKIAVMNRYFLDYRHPKVIAYMNETVRRMVEDYGAEYIKFDYNQDLGIGVDDEDGYGEGLRQSAEAYLNWAEAQVKKYPHVIFEGCSSGGGLGSGSGSFGSCSAHGGTIVMSIGMTTSGVR